MAFSPEIALEYLRGARERERLAHAYLIAGAPGSGKRDLAAKVAQMLNGAELAAVFSGNAPDVFLAAPESKSRRIVIEQIRDLEHALQMRARAGRRKVAIISEADRMLPQAANAFLKTLEEPPNDSLLLLLSAVPEVLPDTILSRCLMLTLAAPNEISFSPEQKELLALLAQAAGEKQAGVQAAFRLTQGVQQLLARMRAAIHEENTAALTAEESRYKKTTEGKWLEGREEHYKALTESLYLQQRGQLLETLFLWWADVLRASTGVERRELPEARAVTDSLGARLTTPEILRRIRRLEELRDHLSRSVQEALALEAAFLTAFRFDLQQ